MSGTNSWQRYSVSGTVPAGVYMVQVAVVSVEAEGTVWVDGIQVQLGPETSPFSPGALEDMETYFYHATAWNGALHSDPGPSVSVMYRLLPPELGRWNSGTR